MEDRDFDEYLSRDSELSRLYSAGATERAPESAVSEIVARSKERLARPDRNGWRRRAWKWLFPTGGSLAPGWPRPIPVSAAAVLVVVMVIGVRTETEIELQPPVPANLPPVSSARPGSQQPSATAKMPTMALPAPASAEAGADITTPAQAIPVANPKSLATSEEPSPPVSAEAWLDSIDKLLEEGIQAEARIAFYAFREQYPNHPLPEGLLQRLGM